MKIRDLIKFDIDPMEIEEYLNKFKNNEAIVSIAGEFSAGKSTFLNALIGKNKFLPEALKECTPVLIDLIKSDSDKMFLVYNDGSTKEVEKREDSIEMYARYTKEYDENLKMITVPVESQYLTERVHFVDTPGSNTIIGKHEEIANYILKKSDVILYVINKGLKDTDFKRLEKIKKYTDDIIIIITHIDQTEDGQAYKPKETIDRFVQEAAENINDKLGIEDIDIFPVGSIQALHDDAYIKPIRECIDEYIEENTYSIMKKRVEKQLSVVFQNKQRQLHHELELLLLGVENEQENLVQKIERFEEKINKVESNNTTKVKRLKDLANQQKAMLKKEIETLINEHKEKLLSELISSEVTSEDITNMFVNANENISNELIKKIEQKIQFMLETTYQEMNNDIKNILETVNIDFNQKIEPPKIDELDYEIDQTKVVKLAKTKENYKKYLEEVEEEIAVAKEKKESLLEQKKMYEKQLQEVIMEMKAIGDYEPQFVERVITGGGDSGAKIGRVIGEVADIAMIFWNPAGGAVKAADTAKDASKIANLIHKASKNGKKVKNVKEAGEIANKLKKAKDKAEKLVIKGNEAIEKIDELTEQLPEQKQKTFLDLLDYVSLGYWGEKIGKSVGEKVEPTKVILEENKVKKQEWQMAREIIEQKQLECKINVESIERELEYADSIKEKRRLKKQLEEKINRQNQLIEEKEQQSEREKRFNIKKEVEEYYKKHVNDIFDTELKNINNETLTIMDFAIEKIQNRYKKDIDKEIKKLKEGVVILQKSKVDLELDVKRNKDLLEEISQYKNWIKKWVEAYADC